VPEGASRQARNLFERFPEIRPQPQHERSARPNNADTGGRSKNLSRPRAPLVCRLANCAAQALTSVPRTLWRLIGKRLRLANLKGAQPLMRGASEQLHLYT